MIPAPRRPVRAQWITSPAAVEAYLDLQYSVEALAGVMHYALDALDAGDIEAVRWILAENLDGLARHFREH